MPPNSSLALDCRRICSPEQHAVSSLRRHDEFPHTSDLPGSFAASRRTIPVYCAAQKSSGVVRQAFGSQDNAQNVWNVLRGQSWCGVAALVAATVGKVKQHTCGEEKGSSDAYLCTAKYISLPSEKDLKYIHTDPVFPFTSSHNKCKIIKPFSISK